MPKASEYIKKGSRSLPESKASLKHFRGLSLEAPQIVAGIWGPPKSFKTPLAFTFPPPVYHINFDRGADPLARHFKGVDIQTHDLVIPADEELTIERCAELLEEFMESYKGALAESEGTVVVDTVSMLWTIITVYMLKSTAKGRVGKVKPSAESNQSDYADANLAYENILFAPKASDMHAAFLVRAKQKWQSEMLIPECQKHTSSCCNLWIRTERDDEDDPKSPFIATVEGSGFDKEHEGMEIVNPTYEKIMKTLGIGEEDAD